MKTINILIVTLVCLIFFGCQKELSPETVLSSIPTVTTTAATSITNTIAVSGGNITDDGGEAISVRGVCWSTSPNPVLAGSHTTDGSGVGAFTSNLTGLTAMTVYYVRAYATNSVGTAYGNEISFTTTNTSTAAPTVTTASLSAITMTTATGGGNVVADGGATVTARGVCWSTTANPTTALATKTTDGTGTGIFTSAITGLTAATTYHVRAYATNSVGTSYGGDSVFTTAATTNIPTITTKGATAVTGTTATSGGTVSSDGGAAVTVRGVCWSTAANPTIALSTKTTDGTGTGTFTSAITGLTASTSYHVRAYATNSVGTAYGNEETFTTTGSSGPDIYVAGYENNGTHDVAKLWKNGVATSLSNSANDAYAYNVTVAGTDVYVAGTNQSTTTTSEPKLWKNGTGTTLPYSCNFGEAYFVFVSGTDVYVAGISTDNGCVINNTVATLWKNNTRTLISNPAVDAVGNSVFVSGSDVYFAGQDNDTAVLWKNGVRTKLYTSESGGSGVYVSGTDVYVAFSEGTNSIDHAKLWKNGVITNLTNEINSSEPSGVYVSGTDVYVPLSEFNGTKWVAKLWKNGVLTALTDGTQDAAAYSVFVSGGDVYVSGAESNGTNYVAKIWKNGVATALTNGLNKAEAYSIFIK